MNFPAPFNPTAFDPTQQAGFKQLPLGTHPVIIVGSEVKPTADNTGGKLVFDLKIIGGPNEGAEGQWTLNLWNQSDVARSIAETQMSALCYATATLEVMNSAVPLYNKPFAVEVTEQKLTAQQLAKQANGEQVKPFTQVSKIQDYSGNVPTANGPAQTAQAPTQPPAPAPAPAAAPAAAGWGAQAPAQAPAPAAAPAAAGWTQNAAAPAAGTAPAWGKR